MIGSAQPATNGLENDKELQILFLSRWFPHPADNGARIRILNLLKALGASHTVDLISFVDQEPADSDLRVLSSFCRHVNTALYMPFDPGHFQGLQGLLSAKPRSVVATQSAELASHIRRCVEQHDYDVIIASEIDMMPYVPAAKTPAVLEELELATILEQYKNADSPIRRLRYGLTWWKLQRYLNKSLPRFAACTVVSEPELARLRSAFPAYKGAATVVPNGVDVTYYRGAYGEPQPDTMIYSGAITYRANYDAVDFFGREIMPLIRARRPNAELLVTGKTGNLDIRPLQRPGIRFLGYLPDVRPAVAQSWLSVIPLRLGGGTRLKMLESLALGTPVVSTEKGAEGLLLQPGRDFLCATTPDAFADAVVRLLSDGGLRATLSQAGQESVIAYDWRAIGQSLCALIGRVARPVASGAPVQRAAS